VTIFADPDADGLLYADKFREANRLAPKSPRQALEPTISRECGGGRVGPHVATTRVASLQEADEHTELEWISLGNEKRKSVGLVDSAFQAAGHICRHMLRHIPVMGCDL
jgi:hypothetical protein